MELLLKQKKELARLLYCEQNLQQNEVAPKVGVSLKTINNWVAKYKWDELRASFITTRSQQLKRIYAQLNEITNAINLKPEGERYANSKEADILVKLTASAKSLEIETSVAETINSITKLITYTAKVNVPLSQQMADVADSFIKTLM